MRPALYQAASRVELLGRKEALLAGYPIDIECVG